MNSAGDMSSKTGSIEIKTYEKSLNWFMRVKRKRLTIGAVDGVAGF